MADDKKTMKAIVQKEYGMTEIERPAITADEVLVKVHAAGLDRGTCHLMAGMPSAAHVVAGLRAPKNPVPGLDVAGVVVAVGGEVTRFQLGDEVFGVSKGSFAEFAAAREDKLARKPSKLTLRAGCGCAGLRDDRTTRTERRRPGAGRAEGADRRRLGRCRQLCRADRHVIDDTKDDYPDGEKAIRPDPRCGWQLGALTAAASASSDVVRERGAGVGLGR